mgnify:FL=1
MIAKCPSCGTGNNTHSSMDGEQRVPEPGDLSLCANCGELAEYMDDGGTLKRFTKYDEMPPEVLSMVMRIQQRVKNSIDVNVEKW